MSNIKPIFSKTTLVKKWVLSHIKKTEISVDIPIIKKASATVLISNNCVILASDMVMNTIIYGVISEHL